MSIGSSPSATVTNNQVVSTNSNSLNSLLGGQYQSGGSSSVGGLSIQELLNSGLSQDQIIKILSMQAELTNRGSSSSNSQSSQSSGSSSQ